MNNIFKGKIRRIGRGSSDYKNRKRKNLLTRLKKTRLSKSSEEAVGRSYAVDAVNDYDGDLIYIETNTGEILGALNFIIDGPIPHRIRIENIGTLVHKKYYGKRLVWEVSKVAKLKNMGIDAVPRKSAVKFLKKIGMKQIERDKWGGRWEMNPKDTKRFYSKNLHSFP